MHTLTIGMAVYDDYDGVYFTIQSLRMGEYKNLIHEIIVIDNNPTSASGLATSKFVSSLGSIAKYVPYTETTSTAIRTKLFDLATGDYVLVMDCHVLLDPCGATGMAKFLDEPIRHDLFHGVLLYDTLTNAATEMSAEWRKKFYGVWKCRPNINITDDPFEIQMHGMGMFMSSKAGWLGFNPLFRGFGGEEGYIHEKYRLAGRKVICLPFVRWLHRFGRPNGVPYRNKIEDRIFNYTVGWTEVGLDINAMIDHFSSQMDAKKVTKYVEAGLSAVK